MVNLTEKDVEALVSLMTGEEMACKKAKIYANTLTDPSLAQEMENVARAHAQRFAALYTLLGGKSRKRRKRISCSAKRTRCRIFSMRRSF